MDLLPQLSAFTVFLAICAVGFLFLLVALVFGGIFDFLETDHDFDTGGPGFFSSRVMAVFVTAFGGFGAVATYYGLAPVPASLVGFASGLVFGGAIYALARFLYNQQASTDVQCRRSRRDRSVASSSGYRRAASGRSASGSARS